MTAPESDRQRLHDALADQRFLEAALAEGGMPISAGYVPADGEPFTPVIDTRSLEAALSDRRLMEAALAEGGMPISAGSALGSENTHSDTGLRSRKQSSGEDRSPVGVVRLPTTVPKVDVIGAGLTVAALVEIAGSLTTLPKEIKKQSPRQSLESHSLVAFPEAKKIANMLLAIGEPNRLRILYCLAHGPHHVGQLAEILGIAMVNMSHHLGVMRQCGILEDKKEGRRVIYRLRADITTPGDHPDILATVMIGPYKLSIRKERPTPKAQQKSRRKNHP